MMLSQRSDAARPNAAVRLALLGAGLLAALVVLFAASAVHSTPVSAATGAKIQDRSHDNEEIDAQLYGHFQIINTGTTAVPLSSLTMKYWFTNETPSDPLVFECDYAQVSCANVTRTFTVLSSPVNKANTVATIGFTAAAGTLAPGQSTGEIQTRIHHAAYSNFLTDETYSFISDPSFVYKDTQTVTLYQNGTLIWGVEPR